MTESKAVTMEQIAALAGVSTITVSRALRDSPSVTPATRERIKTLAEAAGYRFNHHARNLRLRRSHMVAVMLEMQPDTDRPMTVNVSWLSSRPVTAVPSCSTTR